MHTCTDTLTFGLSSVPCCSYDIIPIEINMVPYKYLAKHSCSSPHLQLSHPSGLVVTWALVSTRVQPKCSCVYFRQITCVHVTTTTHIASTISTTTVLCHINCCLRNYKNHQYVLIEQSDLLGHFLFVYQLPTQAPTTPTTIHGNMLVLQILP